MIELKVLREHSETGVEAGKIRRTRHKPGGTRRVEQITGEIRALIDNKILAEPEAAPAKVEPPKA